MLYCLLVPACHMLLTPSHATTTSVMASWPHCPSSPLLSPLCDSTHPISSSSSGNRRPDMHPHVMRMMTRRCVPLCAPNEVLMHGEHPGHSTCCNLAATKMCVCVCDAAHYTVWLYECPPPPPPLPLISHNHPLGSFFFFCSHSHSSRLLALRVWPVQCGAVS